jgi:hypothetical protein
VLDWARWCRWALVAVGVVSLALGGVSIFGQPEHEILYEPNRPLTTCGPHGCTFIYRLEVLKVQAFGVVDRRVRIWDEGHIRAYALGRLESRMRVELGFVLGGKTRDDAVSWTKILAGVEAPGSTASVGSAGWTMVLRAWLAIFRVF